MNQRKKIAFVIESLDCGGAEKSLVTLLQNLDYDQFDVDLFLLNRGGVFEQMVPDKVQIKKLVSFAPERKLDTLLRRAKYFYLRRWGKKQHPAQQFWKAFHTGIPPHTAVYDVAISYSQGFCTYYVASKMQATKKYTWLNTDYIKAGYDAGFDAMYYQQYDKVIPVSEEGEATFKNAMEPFVKVETVVIKDISDKRVIVQQSREQVKEQFDKEELNIVTVCRLEPPKGLDLAVQACYLLQQKGYPVHWYLVGDGSERNKIVAEIKALGLGNSFTLLGFSDNPYPYMAQSDIYVQTSRYEGWGLTLIEATLLQKPIVTTNFPTAYNIIKEGVNGYIVPMDAVALADKIAYLADHKSIMQAMASYEETFSEVNKTNSLTEFYKLV